MGGSDKYCSLSEKWTGRKTDLGHPKSKELVFVGYCEESKGYRLIDFSNGKLYRRRDVVFFENQMYHEVTKTEEKVTINLEDDEPNQEETTQQRKQENIEEEQRVQKENVESNVRNDGDSNAEVTEDQEEEWTSFEEISDELNNATQIEPIVEERRYPLREKNLFSFQII